MREVQAVAAIVTDPNQQFLLTYNPKWNGYAFPMRDVNADTDLLPRQAITALETDLGQPLPHAFADDEVHLGRFGVSARTGEDTLYEYWALTVDPGRPLYLPPATATSRSPQFVDYAALQARDDVTWSTKEIARHIVELQEAVVAIITRTGTRGRQFLVVWSNSYRGYFFPTARRRSEAKPVEVARRAVRSDLSYDGEVVPTWKAEVPDVHFSTRYQCDRIYRFHVCTVEVPGVDLNRPFNQLETAILSGTRSWAWLTDEQLKKPTMPVSPTMTALIATVLRVAPGG